MPKSKHIAVKGVKKMRYAISETPNLGGETVTVIAGEGNSSERFTVHETVLREYSDFFDKALGGNWKEKEERLVRLPEVAPDTFKIYQSWLYTGRLFITGDQDDELTTTADGGKGSVSSETKRWKKCFAAGSFLQDHDFIDAAVDVILEKMAATNTLYRSLARYVYQYTSKGGPARRLPTDLAIRHWSEAKFSPEKLEAYDAPEDFFTDLLAGIGSVLAQGKSRKDTLDPLALSRAGNTCRYHEHTRLGKPCYRTKRQY